MISQLSFASISPAAIWYSEEKDDLTASQRIARLDAERVYNASVTARHNRIFERAARGEVLARWERRIVENRMTNLEGRRAA